ncbi:MAG TPA: hypothetical protein VIJ62_12895 [Rhizomicrobium sp.]
MRKLGFAALGALLLAASPALAQQTYTHTLRNTVPTDADASVPSVMQGDQMAIACDALAGSAPDADVRVVMTLTQAKGEQATGYKKLLATNEQVGHGTVRLQVPAAPDLPHHTVHVQVYVMDAKGERSCDGGTVKIV